LARWDKNKEIPNLGFVQRVVLIQAVDSNRPSAWLIEKNEKSGKENTNHWRLPNGSPDSSRRSIVWPAAINGSDQKIFAIPKSTVSPILCGRNKERDK
jgi:hypothetical protein